MTNLQPEIDNLLHQLAQSSIAPFAIADLTNRLQKLLTARWFEQHPIDAPATCVCGTPLAADGTCSREAELDAGEPIVYDGDTEEFVPIWAEPIYDQPSFPHDPNDPDFEYVRENYRANPYMGFIQRYGTAYSHDFNVSQELGEAAIRFILSERES